MSELLVEHCEFPDDVYFDVGKDVWLKPLSSGHAKIGITTVLSFLAGRILKVKLRIDMKSVNANQNIGTLESVRYFGAIKSPVPGKILEFNLKVCQNPSILNDSPYGEGWIVELENWDKNFQKDLFRGDQARSKLEGRIGELKVRCFRALPDEEMNSIGLECSATLANLNELLLKSPIHSVVHIISDDPTADIEMIRWADQTKHELIESRKEANLYHLLVRKTH